MHYFIFGNNSLALILHQYLVKEKVNVDGFCLNEEFVTQSLADSLPLPLYSIEMIVNKYGVSNIAIYLTIAYRNMNRIHEKVFKWLVENGITVLNYIHPSAVVGPNVEMGSGNILLENVTLQPFVKIGNGNFFWNNSSVTHDTVIGNFNYFAPGTTIASSDLIRNRCYFGANSTTKNSIIVEDETLVGAGAYLYKSIEKGSVFVPQRGLVLEKNSSELNLL